MALWIRNLNDFNLRLEWRGQGEVLVKVNDDIIEKVKTWDDPVFVGKTFMEIEKAYDRAWKAMT